VVAKYTVDSEILTPSEGTSMGFMIATLGAFEDSLSGEPFKLLAHTAVSLLPLSVGTNSDYATAIVCSIFLVFFDINALSLSVYAVHIRQ